MESPAAAIDLFRSHSLTSLIQGEIERRILNGDLQPGDRVNEQGLASQLNVSRGPIREACRGLAEAGLLTAVVNRGFFVRQLTRAEVIDLYDVRSSLMRLVGRSLAACITSEQVDVLTALVERMNVAREADDFEDYYAANLEFHQKTVEFTGNARLLSISQGLINELHLYRRHTLLHGGGMQVSNLEHQRILACLKDGDVERAGDEMERHILAAKERFLATADEEAE